MRDTWIQIRCATRDDAAAVASLAGELAQAFAFSRTRFDASYATLLDADDACLLLAVHGRIAWATSSVSNTSPSTRTGQWLR